MHRSLRSREDTTTTNPKTIIGLNFGGMHELLDYYGELFNASFETAAMHFVFEKAPKKRAVANEKPFKNLEKLVFRQK